MLTQGEVEQRIESILSEMESRVHDFDQLCREAAEAEAEYRYRKSIASLVNITTKMSVLERESRAQVAVSDEHKAHLIANARRDSCRESMHTLREMLNGLRTLAASLRVQV